MRNPSHSRAWIVGALAASLSGCGATQQRPKSAAAKAAQRAVDYRLYWAGPSVASRSLTDVLRDGNGTTFVYGTCTPQPTGDGSSCTPPLQIQVTSICARNLLLLDIRPLSHFRARGATVWDYGEGRLELSVGASHVVVWARARLARRALAVLQPVDGRRVSALPPPEYPRASLAQLRRVRTAFDRSRSVRTVRDELHISKSAVRFRLELSRELGAAALGRTGPLCRR